MLALYMSFLASHTATEQPEQHQLDHDLNELRWLATHRSGEEDVNHREANHGGHIDVGCGAVGHGEEREGDDQGQGGDHGALSNDDARQDTYG